MDLTEQQETYRERDPIKVARTFTQSKMIYQGDSKQRMENPDYHPVICQMEDGTYRTPAGATLDPDEVPEYVLDQGPPPDLTPERAKKKLDMRQAMLDAGVPDTDPTAGMHRIGQQNQQLAAENANLKATIDKLATRLDALESAPAPSPAPAPAKRGPGRPRKN